MLKWLLPFLLLPGLTFAQQVPFDEHISEFCGINDSVTSSKLKSCESPNAENVLTDGGSLEPIWGTSVKIPEVLAGHPIKGHWQFIAPDGTKYLIIHASSTVYYTDFSGDPVALRTVGAEFDIDAVTAFGRIYFVNGSDAGWYWDGTSTATITDMPIADHIGFAHERLYVANTSVSGSEVATSSFGSGSYWTVPPDVADQPDAPNSFRFHQADGDAITCFKLTPWGWFIGKNHSTHLLKGYDNLRYYKRILDPDIGCLHDRLVQMLDGSLVWASQDGVYAWGGAGKPELISKDIENRFKQIRNLEAAADFWDYGTQAQWESGIISQNGPSDSWSTTAIPAKIVPSSITFLETSGNDFSRGDLVVVSTYRVSGSLVMQSTGNIVFNNIGAEIDSTTNWETNGWNRTSSDVKSCKHGTYFWQLNTACGVQDILLEVLDADTETQISNRIVSIIDITGCYDAASFQQPFISPTHPYKRIKVRVTHNGIVHKSVPLVASGKLIFRYWDNSGVGDGSCIKAWDVSETQFVSAEGTYTSQTFDTLFSTPVWGPFGVNLSSSANSQVNFEIQSSTSGGAGEFGSWVGVGPNEYPNIPSERYYKYKANFTLASATNVPSQVNSVSLAATSTGQYFSGLKFIGDDITSWSTGDFDDTLTRSDLVSYYVRTASYAFAQGAASPAWVAHTNNQIIQASTNTYYQFRTVSGIDSSSQTVIINKHIANWNEGEAPTPASIVDDHRYIMCVPIGGDTTVNNSCEIFQKNKSWTRLTGPSIGSLGMHNDIPLAGDGSTGSAVWEFMREGVTNFAGSAIESFWETPDFTQGASHHDKSVREIWVDADYQAGGNIEIGYVVNKSTSYATESLNLDDTDDIVDQKIDFENGFERGRYYRVRVRNTDLDDPFKIHVISIYGDIEPRYQ